tara:strand:- start:508 stop:630 length:123 start_codon:yes stop_codon:yes gene_type:complete
MPGHYKKNTEKTKGSPKHKPGGPNSQFNKDGTPKKRKVKK